MALPSEATFSRAFAEFTKSQLPERVHAALIEKYERPRLVGHISRDATAIEGRERAAKKVKKAKELPKPKGSRRKKGEAQKQTLDAPGAATKHEPGGDARGSAARL